ncbi:hypothetical protein BDZ89DRAFT_1065727 [Hymenopellis radicata]|nr:hypothetical protein BDZ89DRAFT_1065727 [Hymenopellis radicata]
MYLHAHYAELDIPVLHDFIQSNPLGILISAHPSSSDVHSPAPDIEITHLPWILDTSGLESNPLGKLRGHMARANPHAKALLAAFQLAQSDAVPVTVLFNGPVAHYVTPKFYVETKPATGKVAPTWNYSAVQVTGLLRPHGSSSSFLQTQLEELASMCEGRYTEGEPWRVSDAPERFVEVLKKAIVGVEIEITKVVGKSKMSQELGAGDRAGVVAGFEAAGSDVGRAMAQCVRVKDPDRKSAE